MKFGCCVNMIADQGDPTGSLWIGTLKELGFDYVELPMAQMMELEEASFQRIESQLKECDIPCRCSNNMFPVSFHLTGEDRTPERVVLSYLHAIFTKLERLNAQKIVFGSGPAKRVPDGFPKGKAYDQLVKLCRTIAHFAKESGVQVVLEPLNSSETNILNTFQESVLFSNDVNEPEIKVLADYYHVRKMEEPFEHILEHGVQYLRHIHFSNPDKRVMPTEADTEYLKYLDFFRCLKNVGYDDTISMEAYRRNNTRADLGIGLSVLKQIQNTISIE